MNLLTIFALSHFITFNDFSMLSLDDQYSYLDENIDSKSQIVTEVRSEKDLNPRYANLYHDSKKQVAELYFEANYYSSVGEFQLTYSILHSSDNKVLGFGIKVFQAGCMFAEDDLRNGSPHHYNTKKEAESDSCSTDADISWTTYLVFDRDANLIESLSDDYFEWTGH